MHLNDTLKRWIEILKFIISMYKSGNCFREKKMQYPVHPPKTNIISKVNLQLIYYIFNQIIYKISI